MQLLIDPKTVLRHFLPTFAGAVALISIAGFIDSSTWLLNLCAQFRIAYVAIFFACAMAFAVRKQFAFAGSCLLLLALNFLPLIPSWRASSADSASAGHALRVLQMNLWVNNKDYRKACNFIQAQAPDVVALEEYSVEADRAFGDLGLWRDYPYRISVKNNYAASQVHCSANTN